MRLPRQCALLVGGLGTRLGSLTAQTPKPLLDCGGRPFLAWIMRELCRFGIEDFVLLAGYKSENVEAFCDLMLKSLPKKVRIRVSAETKPAGTGGAMRQAKDLLDDTFLLANGDSWFDVNLMRFLSMASHQPSAMLGCMLLRKMEDCSRYGTVECEGSRIVAFREKRTGSDGKTINCGIYVFDKRMLDFVAETCSLETDVLPVLAGKGLLCGETADGYFIDIGIPDDYKRAGIELAPRLRRRAVFFDRDGVLNEDYGHVGGIDRFRWVEGAKAAIRRVNDAGWHAFLVTNQAGVAKGMYTEEDVDALHRFMLDELRSDGAFLDDIRYCPYHPEATVAAYRKASEWRKPAPGMIDDLIAKWEVTRMGSVFVGDKETDMQAAHSAHINGVLFAGGNLLPVIDGVELQAAKPTTRR